MLNRVRNYYTEIPEEWLHSIDVNRVMHDAISLTEPMVGQYTAVTGLTVTMYAELAQLPRVNADPDELLIVFVNLILNARDAMPKGGTIRIATECRGDKVVARVADEGRAIPASHLKRIFHELFTSRPELDGRFGLPAAREALARFDGAITASNLPGGGAVFEVSLPLAERKTA